ncbi:glycosyltransferase [Sphaerothrix gracilis]|uniref:glycosyltransferase n=1 Tax=Sphaerothrix gracilis TaxID=3151835 RepID=UPI0031FDDADE
MLYPIKVADIELSQPLPTLEGLEGYLGLQGLVRLHGVPIGYVQVPITNGCCTAHSLSQLILEQHSDAIVKQLLKQGLAVNQPLDAFKLEDLWNILPLQFEGDWPLVTVAVCTRDRPEDIDRCLAAIMQLDYPRLDLLVVDNAPTNDATQEIIAAKYPQVRYVREPRPGLDWARNRAILEAKGEIIAYTDDDVVVDPGWVKALAQVFAENSDVMAVTGLVVPYELETEAQVLFEHYGGFGRGFERKWYRAKNGQAVPWRLLGAGQFGTGANMAYRRSVFDIIGYFDPALDVGTATNGGGDLEMFFRVIKAKYTLVYEPQALIRHRHRRPYAKLKTQISNNGSLYAMWSSIAATYADQRLTCLYIGIWWMLYWNMRRLIISYLYPGQFPRDLIWAELRGGLTSLRTYPQARQQAAKIQAQFGPLAASLVPKKYRADAAAPTPSGKIAIRTVELSQPLRPLADLADYAKVRVFLTWRHKLLDSCDIDNCQQTVSTSQLITAIVNTLNTKLLGLFQDLPATTSWAQARVALAAHYQNLEGAKQSLPEPVPVSIILATYDRPDDLRNCLRHLQAQETARPVEIVVIDNHPASGLTAPIVAEFSDVVLINEPRQGLAYARNAGFIAATGEILIATDDDVTMPPDWIERLVAPFCRPDVMVVTGHVLPIQLDTPSQQAFENYGGLGRGFEPLEVGADWYELFPHKPSPTWSLGATANAAFRSTLFSHPEVGLMAEALGPGMPSGVGEDTYLFYKVLKAGYTILYHPTAYVWHKHRTDQSALKRQLYNYSKGHVAYNLTTWLQDGDWRGLAQVLLGLPLAHYYRIKERLLGRSDYPISLIWLEIRGNLAGPWSLWQSYRRVKREGRSRPPISSDLRMPAPPVASQSRQVETFL